MISAILVFNNHGKPRVNEFYQHFSEAEQQQIVKETFQLVSKREDHVCNFLEGGGRYVQRSNAPGIASPTKWLNNLLPRFSSVLGGGDYKLIYRHYATLYFVFCVDSSESELGILDLIQVFVETLDKCFENVCELDLIFHMDKVGQLAILLRKKGQRVMIEVSPFPGPLHPQRTRDGWHGAGDEHDGDLDPD